MTSEALRHNTSLKEIVLAENNIEDAGATALAEASEQICIICTIIYTLMCLVFTKPLISLQMFDVIARVWLRRDKARPLVGIASPLAYPVSMGVGKRIANSISKSWQHITRPNLQHCRPALYELRFWDFFEFQPPARTTHLKYTINSAYHTAPVPYMNSSN